MSEAKFYHADFHVHTPASHCYEGEKTDNEYINILKRYNDADIKIIAITDHNTLSGFKKISEIKSNIELRLKILSEFDLNIPQINSEISKLKENLNLFNEMLILPGIELTVNPGIHMLMIFKPSEDLEKINSFLTDSGYTSSIQGSEEITDVKIDILSLYEWSKSIDSIVIAAHADSDKGIYNDLKRNTYRARIFSSSQLNAISFNNAVTAEKINAMFEHKEYKRSSPVAFIQASDFHGEEDKKLGGVFIKLHKLEFSKLLDAFQNPGENISLTENPNSVQIIDNAIKNTATILLKDIDDLDKLSSFICAILNNGYGTILVGITEDIYQNKVGIAMEPIKFKEQLSEIIRSLFPNIFLYNYEITSYQWGKQFIYSIYFKKKCNTIFEVEKRGTFILEDKIVNKANTQYYLKLRDQNFTENYDLFNEINEHRSKHHLHELQLISDNYKCFSIFNFIKNVSVKITDIVDIKVIKYEDREVNIPEDMYIGNSKSEVYIVPNSKPHLEDAYLRVTCPCSNLFNNDDFISDKYHDSSIVVSSGGACFLINTNNEHTIIPINKEPILRIRVKEDFAEYVNLTNLIAYFKSSLLIWSSYLHQGHYNLYQPNVFLSIPIKADITFYLNEEINSYILDICKIESDFIDTFNENYCDTICSLCENEECECTNNQNSVDKLILEHNDTINEIAANIDKIFYNEYEVSNSQVELIEQFMKSKKLLQS